MIQAEVIELLKNYKRNIALHERLKMDYDYILGAQVLSDMPRGSGTSDPTPAAVARTQIKNEQKDLWRLINVVNIWLEMLHKKEKYVLEAHYIDGYTYEELAENYAKKQGTPLWYTPQYWHNKRNTAINKILDFENKQKKGPI